MNQKLNELIEKWEERLKRFHKNPDVAKGMDARTAMGVQHGRTIALQDCLKELVEVLKD